MLRPRERRRVLRFAASMLLVAPACQEAESDAPPGFCGDGVVNPGEACDDGDDDPHDACNDRCEIPGSVAWTYTEASPVHGGITAHAIAVDPGEALYVVGAALQERLQRIFALAVDHRGMIVAASEHGEPSPTAWVAKLDGEGATLWSIDEPLAEVQDAGETHAYALAIGDDDRIYVAGAALDSIGYHRLWVQERAP